MKTNTYCNENKVDSHKVLKQGDKANLTKFSKILFGFWVFVVASNLFLKLGVLQA